MSQAFGSISEDLSENFFTFGIHSSKCLPHHSTEEKVLALEAGIVLPMFLTSGIIFTGFQLAHVVDGQRTGDCDVDSDSLALRPVM